MGVIQGQLRGFVVGRVGWWLSLLFVVPVVAHAERLPIRVYTTADGLGQNTVNRIVRDSRGFLWFSTDEGLSRFDGYAFTNYTIAHGLPHPVVQDVLETRSGVYWVGTGGGLYRFNPSRLRNADFGLQNEAREIRDLQSAIRNSSEPMFVLYRPNDNSTTGTVNVLLEDRSGAVWCGAGRGLYRLEQTNGQWTLGSVEIGLPREVENDMRVRALVENRQGDLWIGAESGLYRRRPDGRTARYTTEQGLPANEVRALLVDTNGHLWVGTRSGVVRIEPEPTTDQLKIIRVYTAKDGLRNPNTRSLFQSSTGRLWVGSSTMLVELVPNENQAGSRLDYDVSELGLSKLFVQTLAEDRDGNLWIGTDNGALKLARNGFTTYTEADGLGESRVSALFESRGGDLGVVTLFSSATPLSWFEGKRFKAIRPQLPRGLTYFGWGWHQLILQDQAGEWWLPTGQGLVRYPKVNHLSQLAVTPPKAIYTTKDGLVSNDVFRLYEDSRGDIWMATFSEARSGITRWERARERFHHYGEADGLPLRTPIPYSFGEDRAGNVWIGCGDADSLARFSNGRFTLFTSEHGVPAGKIHGLYLDNAGRLWIGSTTGGLARLDDPSAERPRFITYTTAQGLSSSSINCITEDRYGRLYIGTARGVDRLDPATGRVKQFTSADGLITGEVVVSVRDRNGDLWFGGQDGLSRLSPQLDPPQSPPLILINGVRVAGNQQPISALGETALSLPDLTVDRNQLQVDFVGLSFAPGESLRYQYRLAGADREWSAPTDQRTVNYANLAPGTYQFFVRAINSNGMASPTPATIHFTILPPVWQRWWFVMLAALVLSLIGYVGYRTRVAQLLALERVRTRIATDLHDDIGSSLSRIAILSEVVKQQPDIPRQDSAQMLGEVAETARGLMEAMSDIVWAIDPRRDDLNNLVYRIRRFASDVLEAKHIRCEFQVPTGLEQIKLTPEQRRHVYLIFKEAIHNIVRHADCTAVSLAINVSDHQLVADIRDDGRGFAQPPGGTDFNEGHGLESMRNRAAQLGGQLKIDSAPGSGTCVKLSVPLK